MKILNFLIFLIHLFGLILGEESSENVGHWELIDDCNKSFKKFTCLKFQGVLKLINLPVSSTNGNSTFSLEIPSSADSSGSCCIEPSLNLKWKNEYETQNYNLLQLNFTTRIISKIPLIYRIKLSDAKISVPTENLTLFMSDLIQFEFQGSNGLSYQCESSQTLQNYLNVSLLQFQVGHSNSNSSGFAKASKCNLDTVDKDLLEKKEDEIGERTKNTAETESNNVYNGNSTESTEMINSVNLNPSTEPESAVTTGTGVADEDEGKDSMNGWEIGLSIISIIVIAVTLFCMATKFCKCKRNNYDRF